MLRTENLRRKYQRGFVDVLRKTGFHLQSLELFDRGVKRLSAGGGESGLFLGNLFFDRCDLLV